MLFHPPLSATAFRSRRRTGPVSISHLEAQVPWNFFYKSLDRFLSSLQVTWRPSHLAKSQVTSVADLDISWVVLTSLFVYCIFSNQYMWHYMITGDPLHSRALAHSRAPLLTQPCPHCSHSRAPGEQWARLCVFTLQGCVQAARLCRGPPVMICFITYLIKAVRILFIDELGVRQHRGHCGLRWCCIQWRHYSVDAWRHNSVDADAWRRQQRIARKQ